MSLNPLKQHPLVTLGVIVFFAVTALVVFRLSSGAKTDARKNRVITVGTSVPIKSDLDVRLTGLRRARWVVMSQDDGSGMVTEGFLGDLPRMYGCCVQRSPEHLFIGNQLVLAVQKQHTKTLLTIGAE